MAIKNQGENLLVDFASTDQPSTPQQPKKIAPAPTHCSACGLRLNEAGICISVSCPNKPPVNWLEAFAGANGMSLPFTREELERLVRANAAKDPADLFMLTRADFKLFAQADDSRADMLIGGLDRARKSVSFIAIVAGLSIPTIGKGAAEKLWKSYDNIYDLASAAVEDLIRAGLDKIQSEYVVDFFNRPEITELMIRLEVAGIPMVYQAFAPPSAPQPAAVPAAGHNRVRGKHFVFTGKLETMTRAQAESKVNSLGGYFQEALNSMTDYLVVGARVGKTKTNAAKKHGTQVITEEEFYRLAGER